MLPTINEIRTRYNLTQAAMAERFGIPKRTIENWDEGSRKPPEYVVRMMLKILELEK
ncbi:MAG: helix-turn-helix domain-containing protein [Oscillospiraceae bacterium]|nr:helix-turn-helix domain-containing protein [Oscillospiraceae bacterium]